MSEFNFEDDNEYLAFSTTDEAQAFQAELVAICEGTKGDAAGQAKRLRALAASKDASFVAAWIGFRCEGYGNLQRAMGQKEIIPAPVITEKAPSRDKPKDKQKKEKQEATKEEPWKLGSFESERQMKRIAVFLRRRRSPLSLEQWAQLEKLAKEVRNDSEGKKRRKPQPWMLDLIGQSQLPPAAIEWLLRFGYRFKSDEAESLEAAQIACAHAILKERYVYLPDTLEAYRVSDRRALSESSAVAEMQKWFGMSTNDKVIKLALRAHCPQAKGKVRLPGRGVSFLHDGDLVVNEWTPPNIVEVVGAKAEDVRPYLDHVVYVMGDEAEIYLSWVAAHVQAQHWHKHQRWGWIMITDGGEQTGKGALMGMTKKLIGSRNLVSANCRQLDEGAELYAFLNDGSFVVFDEAHIDHGKVQKLKGLMGSESVSMRRLHKNATPTPHGASVVILSNNSDCVKLDKANTRFMVIQTPTLRKPQKYYDDLRAWEDDPQANNMGKVLGYLRGLDLSAWNFDVRPYATAAEEALVAEAHPAEVRDIMTLIADRAEPFTAELIDANAARTALNADKSLLGGSNFAKDITTWQMTQALKAGGATPLGQIRVRQMVPGKDAQGKPCEKVRDQKLSLWALRHGQEWQGLKAGGGADDHSSRIRGYGLRGATYVEAVAKVPAPQVGNVVKMDATASEKPGLASKPKRVF